MLTQILQGRSACAKVRSAFSPKAIISFSTFLRREFTPRSKHVRAADLVPRLVRDRPRLRNLHLRKPSEAVVHQTHRIAQRLAVFQRCCVEKRDRCASHPALSLTDLSAGRRLRVVGVIRRAAQREENRRVENEDRVQARKHAAVDAGAYVLPKQHVLLPTLCMSFHVTVTWIEFWLNESSILNRTSHFPAFT